MRLHQDVRDREGVVLSRRRASRVVQTTLPVASVPMLSSSMWSGRWPKTCVASNHRSCCGAVGPDPTVDELLSPMN